MRAVAAFPGSTQPDFVDVPEPGPPGPGEILGRTVCLGVCGTDREILHSARPMTPHGQPFLVLGHECLGRVEAVGPGVTELRPGQLVVPVVRRPLGRPDHRVDMLSPGTFTEAGIIRLHGFSQPRWIDRPEYLVPVPEELGWLAVLTEPLSVAEKAVNEAIVLQRARLDDSAWTYPPPRVLVTGLGPIAMAGLLACRVRGWPATIYGRDRPDSSRVQLAARLGAAYLSEDDGLEPPDDPAGGYDLVLECTGSDEVLVPAARLLGPRGVMAWLGSSRQPEPREHNVAQMMRDAVPKNHLHVGCVNAAPRDFAGAVAHLDLLCRQDADAVAALVTAQVGLDDSLWHFHHRAPGGIKTVIVYES